MSTTTTTTTNSTTTREQDKAAFAAAMAQACAWWSDSTQADRDCVLAHAELAYEQGVDYSDYLAKAMDSDSAASCMASIPVVTQDTVDAARRRFRKAVGNAASSTLDAAMAGREYVVARQALSHSVTRAVCIKVLASDMEQHSDTTVSVGRVNDLLALGATWGLLADAGQKKGSVSLRIVAAFRLCVSRDESSRNERYYIRESIASVVKAGWDEVVSKKLTGADADAMVSKILADEAKAKADALKAKAEQPGATGADKAAAEQAKAMAEKAQQKADKKAGGEAAEQGKATAVAGKDDTKKPVEPTKTPPASIFAQAAAANVKDAAGMMLDVVNAKPEHADQLVLAFLEMLVDSKRLSARYQTAVMGAVTALHTVKIAS